MRARQNECSTQQASAWSLIPPSESISRNSARFWQAGKIIEKLKNPMSYDRDPAWCGAIYELNTRNDI